MFTQAWEIYKKSFRTVSANFGDFVKIWLLTYVITMLIAGFISGRFADGIYSALIEGNPAAIASTGTIITLSCSLFALFVFSGLCVRTHRYIILNERKVNWMPFQFNWGITFGYFWRLLVITLIFALILFVMAWILEKILGYDMQNGGISSFSSLILWFLGVGSAFFSAYLTWRMVMALVGTAVEQPIGIFATFKLTRPQAGLFFALIVYYVIFAAAFIVTLNFFVFLMSVLPANGFGNFMGFLIYVIGLLIALYAYVVFITMFSNVFEEYYYKKKATS